MLRVTARLAVVFWGIWVAFSVVRILAAPYVYYSSLEAVRQSGYAVSFFRDVLWEPVHSTVIALSLLVAPFLVRRAMSR